MPPGVLLAIAIVSEVVGTSALRESDGFTKPVPVAIMLATYVLAFYLLSVVVRDVPVALAYAIWAAAGTALIAVVGAVAFDEQLSALGVAGVATVVAGILLINLSGL